MHFFLFSDISFDVTLNVIYILLINNGQEKKTKTKNN